MKEIIYSRPEDSSNTKEKCPVCAGKMKFGTIPCPDGKAGCLVSHYGFTCLVCGKIYK